MKNDILYPVLFLLGILVGMLTMDVIHNNNIDNSTNKQIDTSYNKVKLDSIKFNIGKHDTTIYELNIQLKDEIEKTYRLNDSATIELFKQLVNSAGE